MKYKEPVVGIEPTTGRLRSDYSTAELHRLVIGLLLADIRNRYSATELHRLIDCLKHVMNALAEHLTLAIILFEYCSCQALFNLSFG